MRSPSLSGDDLWGGKENACLGKGADRRRQSRRVGRSLINVVPNAYEPVLERYLGKRVVVESIQAEKILEQTGALQEYSAKYILVRAAEFLQDLPL